jgi:hypothetical protein
VLIIILVVLVLAVLAAVVYLVGFRNKTPSAADVVSATGIRSVNTSTANAPQYDLNLSGDKPLNCTAAGGELMVSGTLTNHSGQASDYDVMVEFRQDGKTVTANTAKVTNVADGATANWTAKSPADISGQFSCKVVEVDRRQAGTQTPN